MLNALGISDAAERTYRALLVDSPRTPEDLAADLGDPLAVIRRSLHELRAAGCVLRAGGNRYAPLPPDTAFEPLIAREQELVNARSAELRRLGEALTSMTRTFLLGSAGTNLDVLEVVTPDHVGERFAQLQHLARRELLGFDKPPYVTDVTQNEVQLNRLAHGVIYKTVYDRGSFDVTGGAASIEILVRAGERARVSTQVPMKLAIIDRRIAMIPLRLGDATESSGLLVHACPLLDALIVLFDAVWERAEPLSHTADTPTSELDVIDRRILELLRAGLTDESIAAQLHIGRRTVTRRIASMAAQLGARTRFQAGMRAERVGWFANSEGDVHNGH